MIDGCRSLINSPEGAERLRVRRNNYIAALGGLMCKRFHHHGGSNLE